VDSRSDAGKMVCVVAEPGESVADVLVELTALGFTPQRVRPATIGSMLSVPAVALVVGSGTQATAQVRRAFAALRSQSRLAGVPIVVVLPAGRIPIADRALHGHELIVRPLQPGELRSRIDRARAGAPARAPLDLSVRAGALRLEPCTRSVWIDDGRASFSVREFELLFYLARHPLRVHSRLHLLRAVWRDEAGVGMRVVDVQVRRVRAKLGDDLGRCIRTVRNVGYAFDEHAARRTSLD